MAKIGRDPHPIGELDIPAPADPLADEDLQLALYACYELHYRGLPGVPDEWEWEPTLLAARRQLEQHFLGALVDALGPPSGGVTAEGMDVALRAIDDADEGLSLSKHLERRGRVNPPRMSPRPLMGWLTRHSCHPEVGRRKMLLP